MEKEMITIVTDMQLSKERLEEIFSVPKTKELFEKFKESNEEKIEGLATRLQKISEEEDWDITSIEAVEHRLKGMLLADSIQAVAEGKSLNQAIQAEIRKQLKEEAYVIKKAEETLKELEESRMAILKFGEFLADMLS